MAELLLAADELTKDFPSRGGGRRRQPVRAVDGVSFELEHGQSLAVVGASGSGKTTVARMLVGLDQPTAGSIFVCGRPRAGGRPRSGERRRRAREMQMVFQDPYSSLDPRQSIRDAIAEIVDLHFQNTEDERKRRIDELLDQVGLDESLGRSRPDRLSGGERQRAAIAKALASRPRVLILDEAVAALDVSIQAQVLNVLIDLRESTGVSYLFLSHDLAVVRQVSDHVIVMMDGRIVERGVADRILDHPQHPYTQLLLSCVPRPGWRPPDRNERQRVAQSPEALRLDG